MSGTSTAQPTPGRPTEDERANVGQSWPFTRNVSGVQSLRRAAAVNLYFRDFNAASAHPRLSRNVPQPVAVYGSASGPLANHLDPNRHDRRDGKGQNARDS